MLLLEGLRFGRRYLLGTWGWLRDWRVLRCRRGCIRCGGRNTKLPGIPQCKTQNDNRSKNDSEPNHHVSSCIPSRKDKPLTFGFRQEFRRAGRRTDGLLLVGRQV